MVSAPVSGGPREDLALVLDFIYHLSGIFRKQLLRILVKHMIKSLERSIWFSLTRWNGITTFTFILHPCTLSCICIYTLALYVRALCKYSITPKVAILPDHLTVAFCYGFTFPHTHTHMYIYKHIIYTKKGRKHNVCTYIDTPTGIVHISFTSHYPTYVLPSSSEASSTTHILYLSL